jgi:hypothetical protein
MGTALVSFVGLLLLSDWFLDSDSSAWGFALLFVCGFPVLVVLLVIWVVRSILRSPKLEEEARAQSDTGAYVLLGLLLLFLLGLYTL